MHKRKLMSFMRNLRTLPWLVTGLLIIVMFYYNTISTSTKNECLEQREDKPKYANQCKPNNHLFFLKTHKTGSTTVQSIIMRYGEKRNLTFAVPINPKSHQFWPGVFRASLSVPSRTGCYDIMVQHQRYDESSVAKAMFPRQFHSNSSKGSCCHNNFACDQYAAGDDSHKESGTKFVTIMRNPSTAALSRVEYYGSQCRDASKIFNYNTNKIGFTNLCATTTVFADLAPRHVKGGLLNPEIKAHRLKAIEFVENQFDLVLITERFDESLILLRHLLCWSIDDIAYVSLNQRTAIVNKSVNVKNRINMIPNYLLEADWVLYNHFKTILEQKIKTFGEARMLDEIRKLHEANEILKKKCIEGSLVIPDTVHFSGSNMQAFQISKEQRNNPMCLSITKTENENTFRIYQKMMNINKSKRINWNYQGLAPHFWNGPIS